MELLRIKKFPVSERLRASGLSANAFPLYDVDFLLLSASVPCEREQDLLKWYNLSSATVVRASTRHKTLRISMMPVYVPRPELMARV